MSTSRCSARPDALYAYAREVDVLLHDVRRALREFETDTAPLLFGGLHGGLHGGLDGCPLWDAAWDLDELAAWVASVGYAFAVAGGTTEYVSVNAAMVDAVLHDTTWRPAAHLQRAHSTEEWMQAVNPRCRAMADAGYDGGAGFIVGRDGARYPLVAPWVVRDGVRYDADDGVAPNGLRVTELDGNDDGWTTIDERIGVERWRDAPSAFERMMMGVGATAGGRIVGSQEADVDALVITPGAAPSFGAPPGPGSTNAAPPPYLDPDAPEYPGPLHPDTTYPTGSSADAAQLVIEGIGGAAMADTGSFAGYDVVFQRNADGRVRALYKRVFVGFDDNGQPYTESVWVTGPEANDQVLINYAPAS